MSAFGASVPIASGESAAKATSTARDRSERTFHARSSGLSERELKE